MSFRPTSVSIDHRPASMIDDSQNSRARTVTNYFDLTMSEYSKEEKANALFTRAFIVSLFAGFLSIEPLFEIVSQALTGSSISLGTAGWVLTAFSIVTLLIATRVLYYRHEKMKEWGLKDDTTQAVLKNICAFLLPHVITVILVLV